MPGLGRAERVIEATGGLSDPEVSVSARIDPEAAAAVERVILDPVNASVEDWQAARDAVPEAFEDGGDR